jgi:hypothetical protein
MPANKHYTLTLEDLETLEALEKRKLLQVPFRLTDRLLALGLIEIAGQIEIDLQPPDRISARGLALLQELRSEEARATAAAGIRGDADEEQLDPDMGAPLLA